MMAPPEENVQSQGSRSYRDLFENGSSGTQSVGRGTSTGRRSPSRSFGRRQPSSTSLPSSNGGGRIHLVHAQSERRRRAQNTMERAEIKPMFHGSAHEDASLSRREHRSAPYSIKSIRPDGSLPGGASTASSSSRQWQQRPRSRSSDGISVGRSMQRQQHSSASTGVSTGNGRSRSASRSQYEQRWERQEGREQKTRLDSPGTLRVGESPPLVTRQGSRRSNRRSGSIGRDTTNTKSVSKQLGSAQPLEGRRIHVPENQEGLPKTNGRPKVSAMSNTKISTPALYRESNGAVKQKVAIERRRGKSAPPMQKVKRSRSHGDDNRGMNVIKVMDQPRRNSMAVVPRDTYRHADVFGGCPGFGGFGLLGGGKSKREIADREEQIAAMQRERVELANENASLRDTMVRIGHRVLDLEEEMLCAAAQQEVELQEVKAEAEEKAAIIHEQEMVKAHADSEQKIEQLELERDEALLVSDRLRDQLEEAVTLTEQMEEQKRNSDSDVVKYKQRFQDVTTEMAELRKNEEILVGQLQQSTDKHKNLVETNQELKKQVHDLHGSGDKNVIVEEKLKIELEQAEKRIKSLEKEVDLKAETIGRLGAENDEGRVRAVKESKAELERMVEAQEEEIMSLKDDIIERERRETDLKRQLEAARSAEKELAETQKIESDESDIMTRRKLEEAEAEIKALKAHAEGKEASFQQVQHELEGDLRESKDEIKRLRDEESMARLAVVEAEKKGSDKRVNELTAMLETERLNGDKRVAELERQLIKDEGDAIQHPSEEENQLLQKQLDEAYRRIKELEAVGESAKEHVKLLEDANVHINDLEAENSEVSEHLVELQRDLGEAKVHIKRLEEGKGDKGRQKSEIADGEARGGTRAEQDTHIQTLEDAMAKATKHIQQLHVVIQEQKDEITEMQAQSSPVERDEKK